LKKPVVEYLRGAALSEPPLILATARLPCDVKTTRASVNATVSELFSLSLLLLFVRVLVAKILFTVIFIVILYMASNQIVTKM
jgi:hypothetical protein